MLFAITRLETVKVFMTSQRMLLKIKLASLCIPQVVLVQPVQRLVTAWVITPWDVGQQVTG